MFTATSSQKFIGRNRAPRVQIEYDVELYGSEQTIELPFVMGVLADLSGTPVEAQSPLAERTFLEIDIDNFDERMRAIEPRIAFAVPNRLTGEGLLAVDMRFESIEDFSPAAIACKVDSLKRLLDARTQLANLQTYMDGKAGAERLVTRLLNDPALLCALAALAGPPSRTTDTSGRDVLDEPAEPQKPTDSSDIA
ncbi:type VI secretion system contractile sheath small subunit [Paraburkholderia sp. BCC1886]|uniref:type VI secretion system contractile sheath small subunit n=1 Tax=Paraburkholderia sp. BCC1886 TaxID=2562670 RepID=UPI0011822435|nr:type VI secretion system contractile sheath small subunit [Paraburkholderia sp. BCC1886]